MIINNKKVTTIAVVVLILALLLSLFIIDHGHNKRYDKLVEQITQQQLENQKLVKIVNEKGDSINTQKVIITSSQEALRSLTDSIFSLTRRQEKQIRNIIAYYTERTSTHIDSVDVPYVDTIAMRKFSDSVTKNCQEVLSYMKDSTITVPRTGRDSTSTYDISLTATKQNFKVNQISIPDSSFLRIDEMKGGLFKKRSYEIKSFHTSPHVDTKGQNSVIFKPKPKRNLLLKSLLVGLGVFIGTKL